MGVGLSVAALPELGAAFGVLGAAGVVSVGVWSVGAPTRRKSSSGRAAAVGIAVVNVSSSFGERASMDGWVVGGNVSPLLLICAGAFGLVFG
jgi:hypothetical protein